MRISVIGCGYPGTVHAAACDVHFLCVGTPQQKTTHHADVTHVFSAVDALTEHLRVGSVVVGKSTVPTGVPDGNTGVRVSGTAPASPHGLLRT